MTTGLGVMLWGLGGGSKNSASKYYGRKITATTFDDGGATLTFADGVKIRIYDGGQSCCESRYMTCDDNIADLIGHTLEDVAVKDGGDVGDNGDCHEIAFLDIRAGHVTVQLATHNEHNGYYGGFGLSIDELKQDKFLDVVSEEARKKLNFIDQNRERLIEAWVAETGVMPSDAVLVEQQEGLTTRVWIERRK